MDIAVWIGSVVALAGVVLGSVLSSRSQSQAWRREEQRHGRASRQTAYRNFLAAVRQHRVYLYRPDAHVTAVPGHDGRHVIALLGGPEGTAARQNVDSAWAELEMVAGSQGTVDRAYLLQRLTRRLAASRAIHGAGRIPEDLIMRAWRAEQAFVTAARTELGLPTVGRNRGDDLDALDLELAAALAATSESSASSAAALAATSESSASSAAAGGPTPAVPAPRESVDDD